MCAVRPFVIRGPHDQTVVVKASVTFQCRVGGDPMPDVLWRRTASGGNMPLGKFIRVRISSNFADNKSIDVQIAFTFWRIGVCDWRT